MEILQNNLHKIIILVCLVIWLASLFNVMINELYIFTTYGISMLPVITPNSTIYCLKMNDYSEDDIVAYLNPWTNEKFLHRIIYKGDEGYYVMKGDNLNQTDPGVMEYKDIICKTIIIQKS